MSKTKEKRIKCLKCHGAGLLACNESWSWCVRICDGCNGHGEVIVFNKTVIKFDVDKATANIPYGVRSFKGERRA